MPALPDKVEELSWLLNSKDCDEADGYAITCKVIEHIAKGRANGTDSTENVGKLFRRMNKISNNTNNSAMLERAIRASLSYNLEEGEDHIYAKEVQNM